MFLLPFSEVNGCTRGLSAYLTDTAEAVDEFRLQNQSSTRALISVEAACLSKQVAHFVGFRAIEMLGGGWFALLVHVCCNFGFVVEFEFTCKRQMSLPPAGLQ